MKQEACRQTAIRALLPPEVAGRVTYLPETAATMDDARTLAVNGAAHGTAVIAGRQTKGRGRMNRAFVSPTGGLYLSVVLRPDALRVGTPTAITAYIALRVCEAVNAVFGIDAGIKWVNDIIVNGKKAGGILVEALAGASGVSAYVVGIGVNVYTRAEDFTDEIKDGAASLVNMLNDGGFALINQLACEIITRVLRSPMPDENEIFTRYRRKLTMLGKRITVTQNGLTFNASAHDIDEIGRLIIERDDGTREALLHGDVSIKV
jgi:BirA family biotin operon repressor/biotin-[acetyl-CoA-carboxylase] ligase